MGVQESYYFEACTHYPKVVSNESDRLDASMMKLNKGQCKVSFSSSRWGILDLTLTRMQMS